MRILTVTHGALVQPELFGDVAAGLGHELLPWEITRQGAPPANGYDAVMVFGGNQNVGEEIEHPWLHEEYDALRRWVEAGTPLLGVCLGAQTLAHALGAPVRALADGQLAGFYDTELTDAGVEDRVLGALPRRFESLNANAYAFEVPERAVPLARGPVVQAFRAGERAWGVQFHPEARRDQVMTWWRDDEQHLPRPLPELERELDEKLETWQELGARLCRAFLDAAA
jgi:GMP synthase-like glutamine amidotransferase